MIENVFDMSSEVVGDFELGDLQREFDEYCTEIESVELFDILHKSCLEFLELDNKEALVVMEKLLIRIDPYATLEGFIQSVGNLGKKLATTVRNIWEKFTAVIKRLLTRVRGIMKKYTSLSKKVKDMGNRAAWISTDKVVFLHSAINVKDMNGLFKQFKKRMKVTWEMFTDMATSLENNYWPMKQGDYKVISKDLTYWNELRKTTALSKKEGRKWKASKYASDSAAYREIQDALRAGSEGMYNLNELLDCEAIIKRVRVRKLTRDANTVDPVKYIRRSAKLMTVSIIENARMLSSINSILGNVTFRY